LVNAANQLFENYISLEVFQNIKIKIKLFKKGVGDL
jgi:hypothetical protein